MLVVEGWIPDFALEEAIDEFKRGNYKYLVTVGGQDTSLSSKKSSVAENSAAKIRELGFDEQNLISVPGPSTKRHHTLKAALAFQTWLQDSKLPIKGVNVITIDLHARKSYTLYKRTLGNDMDVGVISVKTRGYDPNFWWLTPKAVCWVFRFFAGYLYALVVEI